MAAGTIGSDLGLAQQWAALLDQIRNVQLDQAFISGVAGETQAVRLLALFTRHLRETKNEKESVIVAQVYDICLASPDYGGLGLKQDRPTSEQDAQEIGFLLSAWLESLNANDRALSDHETTQNGRQPGRPAMNVTEKIFATHDVQRKGFVKAGDMIRVSIDWVMASEASWSGMKSTYDKLGEPGIFRNDRFWLAGDHVVDPRVNSHPTIRRLIDASEHARKVFKMTEYQGLNYTIMHTEFFRERAQPGMLVIGSDSHTCSSGAVGCLSIGLGAADVTMGLITGELLMKVPEVVNIEFVGRPKRGIGGKDVILYVLQQLKRNTVAADRVVEYTGPGLAYLSPDARFAIANMTTEFGGITGIVVPDHQTKSFIDRRKVARYRSSSKYFRTDDPRSVYAETHVIDLAEVKSFVARYPNPDDVVPVTDPTVLNMSLDGCFIGACTTAEEDLILGALVLEQGLKSGLRPVQDGKKRKVVPGSRPILDKLQKSGLAAIYEDAGFEVGIPGCSYCVGMSADKAGEGEVWLSSQNRNFENRMGQGSIGNLASAATVAASSFEMKVTDPQNLIEQIPVERWQALRGRGSAVSVTKTSIEPDWVEPAAASVPAPSQPTEEAAIPFTSAGGCDDTAGAERLSALKLDSSEQQPSKTIRGKVQRLGDFIDTDALAPAQFLISSRTPEAIGAHCLEFTHPNFRSRVKEGYNVVVAGKAFGCGSSREQAVIALLGCGVQCVIAESFAFIYSRNQPSLGLLGIEMGNNAEFFAAAQDGVDIEVDSANDIVRVGGQEFGFKLSGMEKRLIDLGGITPAFLKFGKAMFDELSGKGQSVATGKGSKSFREDIGGQGTLQW